MKKLMTVAAIMAVFGLGVAHAGTLTSPAVWEQVTAAAQIGMPAGMTSVVKAVKVNGPAMVVNGIPFEADLWSGADYPTGGTNGGYDIAGNGYHCPAGWLVSWPDNIPDTALDNGGCNTGPDPPPAPQLAWMNPVPGTYTVAPNTDYVMEVYFGDHNGRNTQVGIATGGGVLGSVNAPSAAGAWRAVFEFNTGSHTDFEWHVGGDPSTPFSLDGGGVGTWNTAIVSAFALYEGGAAGEPIPEPAGLGLVGLALLAVRKRRS